MLSISKQSSKTFPSTPVTVTVPDGLSVYILFAICVRFCSTVMRLLLLLVLPVDLKLIMNQEDARKINRDTNEDKNFDLHPDKNEYNFI